MARMRVSSFWRSTVPLALILSIGVLIVAPSAVATGAPKKFRADFDTVPDPAAAGSTALVKVQLWNDAAKKLGSSDIFAPSGWIIPTPQTIPITGAVAATIVGNNKIELRNLSLGSGKSLSFSFTVTAPCSPGEAAWTIDGKQSKDHTGSGNFVLNPEGSDLVTSATGACHLAFRVEDPANTYTPTGPADAEKNAVITTAALAPGGPPIKVEAEDGLDHRLTSFGGTISLTIASAVPSGGTLSGTTSVAAASGVASFAPTIDKHGVYTLRASATDFDAATSAEFAIADDACATGETCTVIAPDGTMSVETTNPPSGVGTTVMSVGLDDVDCGDSFRHAPFTTTVEQVGGSGGTQIDKVTISGDYVNQAPPLLRLAPAFQVCFNGSEQFRTFPFGNDLAEPDSTLGGYTGLLPLCIFVLDSDWNPVPPCVLAKYNDLEGNVIEHILFTPGDPKHK